MSAGSTVSAMRGISGVSERCESIGTLEVRRCGGVLGDMRGMRTGLHGCIEYKERSGKESGKEVGRRSEVKDKDDKELNRCYFIVASRISEWSVMCCAFLRFFLII